MRRWSVVVLAMVAVSAAWARAQPAGAEVPDPGELFPAVTWEKATGGVPSLAPSTPAAPPPELKLPVTRVDQNLKKAEEQVIAQLQRIQTAETKAAYQPISTAQDIADYEKTWADKEKRSLVRPDTALKLAAEIRSEAGKQTDRPGLQRYMLMRSVILVRKARAPGSVTLQGERAEQIVSLDEALTPLLTDSSAATLFARTQLVAGLSDVLIERAKLIESQAQQLKFDASRQAEMAVQADQRAKVSEAKAASADTSTPFGRALARNAVADRAAADKAQKDAEDFAARAAKAAELAEGPGKAAKEAMVRGYDAFRGLAEWQLLHGYLDQAGPSLAEAARYANMLGDDAKRREVEALSTGLARKVRLRDQYLRSLASGQIKSGAATSAPATGS